MGKFFQKTVILKRIQTLKTERRTDQTSENF